MEIVHIIDPGTKQGVYSSFADSQSIAQGNKFTHEEMIENEKTWANRGLYGILSITNGLRT